MYIICIIIFSSIKLIAQLITVGVRVTKLTLGPIPERNHTFVTFVTKVLVNRVVLQFTKELTREKNPIYVRSVKKPFPRREV